jgi:hypothetical protein
VSGREGWEGWEGWKGSSTINGNKTAARKHLADPSCRYGRAVSVSPSGRDFKMRRRSATVNLCNDIPARGRTAHTSRQRPSKDNLGDGDDDDDDDDDD